MAALTERLVGVDAGTFRRRVRRAEELQPVEEGLAFVGVGVGKNHRVEVVCRQGQRSNDSEPVAWDALHGAQLLRLLCPCVARQ